MKTKISTLTLALLFTVLCAGSAFADVSETMIIKLKTDDFEIAETDISELQVGEAETIVTDSGKTIDLLRTADGLEIYVDGEMLDIPEMSGDGLHGGCEMVFISDDDSEYFNHDESACLQHKFIHKSHHGNDHVESNFAKVIIIKKDVGTGDL